MTASAAGLPRPVAIVWDWDNTLVDGWAAIAAGLNAAFAASGSPVKPNQCATACL